MRDGLNKLLLSRFDRVRGQRTYGKLFDLQAADSTMLDTAKKAVVLTSQANLDCSLSERRVARVHDDEPEHGNTQYPFSS